MANCYPYQVHVVPRRELRPQWVWKQDVWMHWHQARDAKLPWPEHGDHLWYVPAKAGSGGGGGSGGDGGGGGSGSQALPKSPNGSGGGGRKRSQPAAGATDDSAASEQGSSHRAQIRKVHEKGSSPLLHRGPASTSKKAKARAGEGGGGGGESAWGGGEGGEGADMETSSPGKSSVRGRSNYAPPPPQPHQLCIAHGLSAAAGITGSTDGAGAGRKGAAGTGAWPNKEGVGSWRLPTGVAPPSLAFPSAEAARAFVRTYVSLIQPVADKQLPSVATKAAPAGGKDRSCTELLWHIPAGRHVRVRVSREHNGLGLPTGLEIECAVVALDETSGLLLYPPDACGTLFTPSRLVTMINCGAKWKQATRLVPLEPEGKLRSWEAMQVATEKQQDAARGCEQGGHGTTTGASLGVEQEQEESEESSTEAAAARVLDLADALRAAVEEESPVFSPLSAPCAELPPWCQPGEPAAAHAAAAPAPDAAEEDAPHDAPAWEEPWGEAAGMGQEASL